MNYQETAKINHEIYQELSKASNRWKLNQQELAASIFYSFAIWVLNNNETDAGKVESLKNCDRWLKENEDIVRGR